MMLMMMMPEELKRKPADITFLTFSSSRLIQVVFFSLSLSLHESHWLFKRQDQSMFLMVKKEEFLWVKRRREKLQVNLSVKQPLMLLLLRLQPRDVFLTVSVFSLSFSYAGRRWEPASHPTTDSKERHSKQKQEKTVSKLTFFHTLFPLILLFFVTEHEECLQNEN